MISLGLSAAERRAFVRALADDHSIRSRVHLLHMDGKHAFDLTDRLLDGQVNVDWRREVTHSSTLSLVDPNHMLPIEADSPADGALFLDRMVSAFYDVDVDGTWVEVPAFKGPITKLDRANDIVNVECQGKEALANQAIWKPLVIKKGTRKTDAIRTILEHVGERHFDIPDLPARLPRRRSLGRLSAAMPHVKGITRGMDRQFFYDGRGTARVRALPENVLYTFDAAVLTPPQISYQADRVRNTIWVKGRTPKASHVAFAQPSHPLSPQRLGRNGDPRHLVEVVEDDSIRSKAEARRVANRILRDRLREVVEVTFDSLPVPHLEPGDLCRIVHDDLALEFRIRTWSLPLSVSGPMSVGTLKKVSVKKRQGNRR